MRLTTVLVAMTIATLPVFVCGAGESEGGHAVEAQHMRVYYEAGRFGGWPANFGMWVWDNEILVGYARGYYEDLGDRHHINRDLPEEHWFARSLDGGETWSLEHPAEKGQLIPRGASLHGVEKPGQPIPELRECPGGIDFTHPDFALTVRMSCVHGSTPSRFYYSYDRGHNWEGPFLLPDVGTNGIAARTDYVVDGQHEAMLFMTAGKSNGREGRPFCMRTTDGGRTWEFVSWIMGEPEGFAIMPATVRLDEDTLLTTIRSREGDRRWISAFISRNNGESWEHLSDPVPDAGVGNPPALMILEDGRLCLTYAVRRAPYRICARLSSDGGQTWTDEIVLRDDGNDRDIGYCRSVQRADGKVVTTYYINEQETGPERYIGATIWDPADIE